MLNKLRLAYGLRWHGSLPTINWREAARTALMLTSLVLLYGLLDRLEQENNLRIEAEAAQLRQDMNIQALLACMNGHAPGFYTEDADGNRTYLVCNKAWEIPVGKPT